VSAQYLMYKVLLKYSRRTNLYYIKFLWILPCNKLFHEVQHLHYKVLLRFFVMDHYPTYKVLVKKFILFARSKRALHNKLCSWLFNSEGIRSISELLESGLHNVYYVTPYNMFFWKVLLRYFIDHTPSFKVIVNCSCIGPISNVLGSFEIFKTDQPILHEALMNPPM
jgi:hypothetical protein